MSNTAGTGRHHPQHGQIGYLQIPALDIERSAAFYQEVFGWSVDLTSASFRSTGHDRPVDNGPTARRFGRAGDLDLR